MLTDTLLINTQTGEYYIVSVVIRLTLTVNCQIDKPHEVIHVFTCISTIVLSKGII